MYDSANHLTSATSPTGIVNYGYDGFGDRVSQTFGTATTHYFFDPTGGIPQLLAETSGNSNNPTTYYLPGLGQDTNGKMGYFGMDALGSVRQITDSNGVMQYAANFDPYGSLLEQNFGTANTSLGYTGAPSDPSGLVYLNARFYNPSIGSFQTHDPFGGSLGSPASQNGYNYAQSNPISFSDPSGKCPQGQGFGQCLFTDAGTSASQLLTLTIGFVQHPDTTRKIFSSDFKSSYADGPSGYAKAQINNLHNLGSFCDANCANFTPIGIVNTEWGIINDTRQGNYNNAGRQALLLGASLFLGGVLLGSEGDIVNAPELAAENSSVTNDASIAERPELPLESDIPNQQVRIPENIRTIADRNAIIAELNTRSGSEKAYGIDNQGVVRWAKVGSSSRIDFTPDEMELIRGGTLIHNHPEGLPISTLDIGTSGDYNLTTIAVGVKTGKIFTIAPPEGGVFPQFDTYYELTRPFNTFKGKNPSLTEYAAREQFIAQVQSQRPFQYFVENVP